MKKNTLILTLLILFLTKVAFSQCSNSGVKVTGDLTPSGVGQSTSLTYNSGQYVLAFCQAGASYTVSTCNSGATYDTQLTLYSDKTGNYMGYSDDACGLSSSVTFTSNTCQYVRIILNHFYCGNTGIPARVTMTQNSGGTTQLNTTSLTSVSCKSDADGSAAILMTNGAAPITYTISPKVGTQNGGTFTNLTPQTYIFTSTDINGCIATTTATVDKTPNPVVDAGANQTICLGSDARLTATCKLFNINATLRGVSEVPPNSSTAIGNVTGTFNTLTNQLNLKGTFSGLSSSPIAAHIHNGGIGINGPVIANLNVGNINLSTKNNLTNESVSIVNKEVTDRLSFSIENVAGKVGDTVCVRVYTRNFKDLIYVRWGMRWDSTKLSFVKGRLLNSTLGSDSLVLPNPAPNNIYTSPLNRFTYRRATSGSLLFFWDDNTTTGVTLGNDSMLIYDICFKLIGASGTSSRVYFDSYPNRFEVYDKYVSPIVCIPSKCDIDFINGSVNINGPAIPDATSGIFSYSGTLSPANAAALLAGNTYVNIHSAFYSSGEIRGQLAISDCVADDYVWKPGNVIARSTFVSPTVNTTYTVTATNTLNGCSSTASVTVSVNTPSVGGTLAASKNAICNGEAVQLSLSGQSGSITQWEKQAKCTGDWIPVANTTNTHIDSPTEQICYRVKTESGVCPVTYSNSASIVVDKPATAGIVTLAVNHNVIKSSICPSTNLNLNVTGFTGKVLNWQSNPITSPVWRNIPNTTGLSAFTVNGTSLSMTTFYRVVICSELGICTGTKAFAYSTVFKVALKANCAPPPPAPALASKEGVPTLMTLVKAYPIPSNSRITLEIDGSTEGVTQIEILDLTGKVVQRSIQNVLDGFNELTLDIDHLSKGLYLVKVKDSSNQEAVLKVSKM